MEFMFEKHYTLEEANELVPALRELFRRVHELMESALDEGAESKKPANGRHMNGNGNGNGSGNGHGHDESPAAMTPEERVAAANEMLKSVAARGIVIQDWRRGLIDFPTIREGEEVFLCYELADGGAIKFFHDIDAGYTGRQPL